MNEDAEDARDQVFISYARDEYPRVEALARYLSDVGFRVFWDPQIDDFGKWRDSLERRINESDVVLVCWSEAAIGSKWVKWEADLAKRLGKYLPVTLDDARPDIDQGFQIRSLKNWHGLMRPGAARALASSIARRLGEQGSFDIDAAEQRIEDHATARTLSIAWFMLALVAAYCSLSAWIASQNNGESPLGLLLHERPIQGSLIAFFLVGLISAAAFRVLAWHASFHSGEAWARRLPRFLFEPDGPSSPWVKVLAWSKLVLAFFPLAAILHLLRKAIKHGNVALCDREGVPQEVAVFSIPDTVFGHVYCFGQGTLDAARNGVTFIPLVEPVAVLLLCGWLIYECARAVAALRPRAARA